MQLPHKVNQHGRHAVLGGSNKDVGRIGLTSILRLNGDDALPLRTEALRGSSLNFELVGDVLSQVWDGKTGFSGVPIHLKGPYVSWRNKRKNSSESDILSPQEPTM